MNDKYCKLLMLSSKQTLKCTEKAERIKEKELAKEAMLPFKLEEKKKSRNDKRLANMVKAIKLIYEAKSEREECFGKDYGFITLDEEKYIEFLVELNSPRQKRKVNSVAKRGIALGKEKVSRFKF